ncbi:hypothetical protein SAMN02745132_00159 [Enterovibrio nigricans DSM 22720]|uniref:Uncharacterized protein n=1 Tax=Enterovibrio nigricans DSM 22720 TaxID=1121868 RepID=A0A1T4TU26_9GAMM|nr:hypothetical protein SAMN02745132_00159 [Enterovibrio nigricans DSM 22720]
MSYSTWGWRKHVVRRMRRVLLEREQLCCELECPANAAGDREVGHHLAYRRRGHPRGMF